MQINSDDYQLIVSSILTSGKIPNGLYTFSFKLRTEDNNILDEINKTINELNKPMEDPSGMSSEDAEFLNLLITKVENKDINILPVRRQKTCRCFLYLYY